MNVEDLLSKKDIQYTPKGRDFLVRCINPEHEDHNPSMRIDQITGVFQCFSCEYKEKCRNNTVEQIETMRILNRNMLNKVKT